MQKNKEMCIKMMYNITTFKNVFQCQRVKFNNAKLQLLSQQPNRLHLNIGDHQLRINYHIYIYVCVCICTYRYTYVVIYEPHSNQKLKTCNVCMLSCFSHVQLFASLWTEAYQAPLSMGLSRKGYWSGLPCPPPGDLPDPGIFPTSLMSLALAGGFFITSTTWEAPKLILDTHERERNPNTKLKKVFKPQGKRTRKKEEKRQKQRKKINKMSVSHIYQ